MYTTFPDQPIYVDDMYGHMRAYRMHLLETRRKTRMKLHEHLGEEEFSQVCEDLKEVSACMKRLRQQRMQRRRADLAAQIWAAYTEQRFSDMHKLR
eukprot:278801-Pyramimonas_sp.AAC.1